MRSSFLIPPISPCFVLVAFSLPKVYGLPKIHKPCCSFRLILSFIDSPLYDLITFLYRVMYKSFPKAKSHIQNSFKLVKRLSNLQLEDNSKLISLNVTLLYTNIPMEYALDSVAIRWDYIVSNCNISKAEFLLAICFILKSTYFKIKNII